MTLAKRVIPTMLVRGRTLVKGERFDGWRSIGHCMQAARVHAKRGVDELLILDIAATAEGRGPDLDMVRELSADCFIPITVGGGVRSLQDIRNLLLSGADKVAIGAGAVEVKNLVSDAAARFGRQAITCIVDVLWPGGCAMYRRDLVADANPVFHAQWLEAQGAGELLVQRVDRDGTMTGYDLDLIREVSQAVSVPVIASGGCHSPQDMAAAFSAGADACAAGALFSFTDCTPRSAAKYLKFKGWEVRL